MQDFVVVVMPYESSSDANAAKSQHAAQRRQTENAILCTWQNHNSEYTLTKPECQYYYGLQASRTSTQMAPVRQQLLGKQCANDCTHNDFCKTKLNLVLCHFCKLFVFNLSCDSSLTASSAQTIKCRCVHVVEYLNVTN
jgi:hypothetical protein